MRPRRPLRLAVLLTLGVVGVFGLWAAWQAWHVAHDLDDAAAAASDLQASVEAADQPGVNDALARLQDASSSAADRTGGPTWAVLRRLPAVGDDATGVALVSEVLDDLSSNGLEPVSTTLQHLDRLLPRDGKVDVDELEALQQPVATGSAAFAAADRRLSEADPSGYVGRLRERFRELEDRVHDTAVLLADADTALSVMPDMLGADGPHNYLLVFQNNAEIRASGGLPGAISLVHTDNGKIDLTRQVAAGSFGETDKPVLPLTPAEVDLFGPQLGTYFLDANFTPDFPRTADLMKARWGQVHPEQLDGVLSIDPVALSYVLEATGPIAIGAVTLTSENAVQTLLHDVYVRFPDPGDQDEFFRNVARTVFDRLLAGGQTPETLIRGLSRGAREGRVLVHLFDADQQETIAHTRVAGELPSEAAENPQVGVYLNDATGAKMSYYLRYDVQVLATSCEDGRQSLSGTMHLRSVAPDDAGTLPKYITGGGRYGTKPGDQLVVVDLYAPSGGTFRSAMVNDEPFKPKLVEYDGRSVSSVAISLEPGQTVDLTWRMQSGPDQPGDVVVAVTPSVQPESSSSIEGSAC